MAQVDVKWPSEDEEFDTSKIEGGDEPSKVDAVDHLDKSTTQTGTETVADTDENAVTDSVEATEPPADSDNSEPETTPEAPSETPEESATDEKASEESPEEDSKPEAEHTEPVVAETEPDSAPQPATEPGSSIAPDTTSEPVVSLQPEAVNNTASVTDKPEKTPKEGGSAHHYGRDILVFVLVLAIAGLGLWSWTLYTDRSNLQQQLTEIKNNPNAEADRQLEALVSTVGKLTSLPDTEKPTIQTVTDAKLAKQQADFYQKAENGDKALLYVNSRQAFLYRPSTNKVITVSTIQIDGNQNSTGASSTSTAPARGTN